MNARSKKISKLKNDPKFRASYLRAKLNVNVPSQVRALRLRQGLTQIAFAEEIGMKQSRISAMESPGATNFNLETLIRLAAAYKVGLIIKFAPFSEVLDWENRFSQDIFDVVTIDKDIEFLRPAASHDLAPDLQHNDEAKLKHLIEQTKKPYSGEKTGERVLQFPKRELDRWTPSKPDKSPEEKEATGAEGLLYQKEVTGAGGLLYHTGSRL